MGHRGSSVVFALLLALLRTLSLVFLGVGADVSSRRSRRDGTSWTDAALAECGTTCLSIRRVLSAVLRQLHAEREVLDSAVEESILNETPRIERFGSAMTVVAAVAPLLGLLGTVTGMIATFDVITEHGTGIRRCSLVASQRRSLRPNLASLSPSPP